MKTGVVVMAYGTPATPEAIPAYYTDIRRGHPPSEEQLANLVMRYATLGGVSSMAARTEAQRARLAAELDRREPGAYEVVIGQRHAAPFIEDAVERLVGMSTGHQPVAQIVGLVLAPHFSTFSIGHYSDRLEAAAAAHGTPTVTIPHWYDLPAYTEFLTSAVTDALTDIGTTPSATKVVFTAHSLPERLLVADPYPEQLRAGAQAVATRAGLAPWSGWSIAWQSAGATSDTWRGPDICQVIRDLAETGRAEGIVVCPHGFTADHLEVAYDLDVQAKELADELGLAFARTRVLNDDATVFAALAEWVQMVTKGL